MEILSSGCWRVIGSSGSKHLHNLAARLVVIVMAASLILVSVAHATEMEAITDKLPHAYVGEFHWDGDQIAQNVVMTFDSVHTLDDQNVEAVGCGAYETNRRVTMIRVRMFVRLSDLQVEILELAPEGNASFETDGSHRGTLSEDLQRIDTQWTTRSSGQRGQLHLRAAPSAVCAPAAPL